MNLSYYLVFDFETDGVDPTVCQPLELAATVLDPRSLEPIGATFSSLIRPDFETLQKDALLINKIKIEDLEQAPPLDIVWSNFCQFVSQYDVMDGRIKKKPIPAGYNIKGYDLIIVKRLTEKFGKEIFSRFSVDVLDICFLWFENNQKLQNLKLDTVREFFSMASDQAHRALFDVEQTALLLGRFIRLFRQVGKSVSWHQ